jgi:hypothetical protein
MRCSRTSPQINGDARQEARGCRLSTDLLRARPRSRAILVEVPVSSMKTSRSGWSLGCLFVHAVGAAATSGRSCSAARTLRLFRSIGYNFYLSIR